MRWLESRLVWIAAVLGLLVMVGGFGFVKGDHHGIQVGITSCSKKIAKLDSRGTDTCALAIGAMQTRYAEAQAKAEADARAKEQSNAAAIAAIDARHAQELKDAQAKSDAVVADLRDGSLRLRREWAGCEAAAGVSETLASTAKLDAAAASRAKSAATIVRIGADADAQIRALQAVIKAERQ